MSHQETSNNQETRNPAAEAFGKLAVPALQHVAFELLTVATNPIFRAIALVHLQDPAESAAFTKAVSVRNATTVLPEPIVPGALPSPRDLLFHAKVNEQLTTAREPQFSQAA